jgi:ABC-type antimicrobial peptide transport system permease subunit
MLGSFGLLALMLAAIGVYGVTAYSVAQRTREVGVRVALGARRRDILLLMTKQGAVLGLVGIAGGLTIGLAAAFGFTSLMTSVLYGVSATDPLTFGSIRLLLAAIVLIACYVPARRATTVDPMVALRYE